MHTLYLTVNGKAYPLFDNTPESAISKRLELIWKKRITVRDRCRVVSESEIKPTTRDKSKKSPVARANGGHLEIGFCVEQKETTPL